MNDLRDNQEGGIVVRSPADAGALGMAFQIAATADGARRFTFVGRRCATVNGVPPEAVLADPALLYRMILPEHQAGFAAAETRAFERMEAFDVEVAMRRADGAVRWHRIASMPRTEPDGTVLWDGLQIDVTERRRMAAELREQRQRLAVAVESTGLGFWEWDLGDGPMTWSDTNRAIYGIPAGEDVTIERYMALIHPEDRATVSDAFAAARGRPEGGDFSAEFRITRPSGELRWVAIHGRASPSHAAGGMAVGTSLDITERKLAEDRRTLLMGELAHRAKNGIAVIMAIVGQTGRGMTSVEDFQTLLMSRLQAMANSQDLVMTSGGGVVALDQVIARTVAPFGPARFSVDPGLEGIRVPGEIAVGMGLLLHELATNAAKYGALSGEAGRVALKPVRVEDGRFAFEWREEGGPPVAASERKGFGTRLFQQVLRQQGGEVSVEFAKQGFRACVEFPIAR